ncbi:MAG: hypothetical protein VYB71_04005 [Chloroflexota bacterium]|nr:hypothetical protein [Chloroflexota bacterium]
MKFFAQRSNEPHASQAMISSYVDSALSNKDMEQVDFHITSCGFCAQKIDEIRAVVGVLRAMPTVPAPRSFAIPIPARSWVPEPSRPWWSPAPLMGLRAAAAGAAIALAVVFAGDLSSGLGSTPDVPIQVGRTEPAPLITSGTPAGAEKSVPLGESASVDPGTSVVVEITDKTFGTSDVQPSSLAQDNGFALGLWRLELGLLAVTLILVGYTIYLRRHSSSL